MDKQNSDKVNQQEERTQPDQNDTKAEKQTPLAERISETGMDQLKKKQIELPISTNLKQNPELPGVQDKLHLNESV